ncbi:HD domain-containing protein [Aquimarina algicola]|uniref:Metal-dependent HD superfamily phosphohydrolase n=1 Tax=Aquimarina algicola TaxID=2589995 RepID=A0A504JAE1_9FLAO|nr:hypothetical protein [Aquimarina algicola]TPN83869.1 hypothetical protein FHK87_18045 [Aquimarina algicola]
MLKETFIELCTQYINDAIYIESLWIDIEKQHTQKKRYYHNLSHLENLHKHLIHVKNDIKDWDMTLFALFYHDYVYNILKQNNEEESAKKAVSVLKMMGVAENRIQLCNDIILATKGHTIDKNKDVNYFTDADLCILGSDWLAYQTYYKNVRKEYQYYPNFLYNKGRIKVLNHFLKMPKIFKTVYFSTKFEKTAKENIEKEIFNLSNIKP